MENINVILVIVAAVAVMVAACALIFPWLKKKGVNVLSTLEATSGVLDATDAITDILKAAFPASAVVNIVDKVIDYAKVGAQKAEQLYIINTISKDERKEEATKFVYEALEIAGVERTAAIEKIVDGAVEAAVLTLGHTVDTDNHGEGYGEGIAE